MAREVGGELMLYDATGKVVHVLNDTARFVWERCDGKHSADDILVEAQKAYDASADAARADIHECLATFRKLSLLRD
jgi:hypothetical protein